MLKFSMVRGSVRRCLLLSISKKYNKIKNKVTTTTTKLLKKRSRWHLEATQKI